MAEKFEYTREWTDANAFPMLGFSKSWRNKDDYPTIELEEAKVRDDMQSLHDEVKDYINTKLIPAVLAEDATEEARAAAEEARSNAEAERQSAEEDRASAEATRQSNEETRQSNEAARVAAEALRASAETAREQAESGRVTAEEARATAESLRASAEELRASAEELRASAEQARAAAEQNRAEAEQGRSTAEQSRDIAEQARAAAETGRASAETARDAAEQERVAADIQRTENAEQVIRDSAQYAYLSKVYASGQVSMDGDFNSVPAGYEYVFLPANNVGSPDKNDSNYVDVGRVYSVTVNGETVETVATYNGISALGIVITNTSDGGWMLSNHNDYTVSGSFETIDADMRGRSASEYAQDAERYSLNAKAMATGGVYEVKMADGTVVGELRMGAKHYADQAKVYAEGGQFDPDPHDGMIQTVTSDGAKNMADKAKAFAESGTYKEYEVSTTSPGSIALVTKTVSKGAKQYAEAAAGSAAAAFTSETNAKASETAAKESETTAKSEADRAKSEADRAYGIVGGDYATKADLAAHTDNADIHVTEAERTAWNAKADKSYVDSAIQTAIGNAIGGSY